MAARGIESANMKGLFSFFQLCGGLKHLKRTGWVNNKVQDPETVAGHMYRMAMLSLLFTGGGDGGGRGTAPRLDGGGAGERSIDARPSSDSSSSESTGMTHTHTPAAAAGPPVDRDRCIRMALVHDLAESLVGDLTPQDGVSKAEKYRRELEAMEHIQTLVPEEVGTELYDLWKEYEEGTSPEAILVKDLDKFDMIFQAFEYENSQGHDLQEFFDHTRGRFQHPVVRKWVEQLEKERNLTHDK